MQVRAQVEPIKIGPKKGRRIETLQEQVRKKKEMSNRKEVYRQTNTTSRKLQM